MSDLISPVCACALRDRAVSLAHAYKEDLIDNTSEENCEILSCLCFPRRRQRDSRALNAIFHLAQLGIKHVSRLRPVRTVESEGTANADSAVDEDVEEIKSGITRAARQCGRGIEGLFTVKTAVQDHFGVESFSDLGQGDFVDFVKQHCPKLFVTMTSTNDGSRRSEVAFTSSDEVATTSTTSEDRLHQLIYDMASPLDPTQPIMTLDKVEKDVTSACNSDSFESLGHGSFLSFVAQRPELRAKFRCDDLLVDVLGKSADKKSVLSLLSETASRSSEAGEVPTRFHAAVQLQYGSCGDGGLVENFVQKYLDPRAVDSLNSCMLFTEASFAQSRVQSQCGSKTRQEAIQAISTCIPLESVAVETQVVRGGMGPYCVPHTTPSAVPKRTTLDRNKVQYFKHRVTLFPMSPCFVFAVGNGLRA